MTRHDSEAWLAERLKAHGVDIYAGGEYPTLRDRLAHAIVREHYGTVVVGKHEGKTQNYDQTFERIFGCTPEEIVRPARQRRTATP